jgi:hypothetical protein
MVWKFTQELLLVVKRKDEGQMAEGAGITQHTTFRA